MLKNGRSGRSCSESEKAKDHITVWGNELAVEYMDHRDAYATPECDGEEDVYEVSLKVFDHEASVGVYTQSRLS